jgi:hypothetical protein
MAESAATGVLRLGRVRAVGSNTALVEQDDPAVGGHVGNARPIVQREVPLTRFARHDGSHFEELGVARREDAAVRSDVAQRHPARDLRNRPKRA